MGVGRGRLRRKEDPSHTSVEALEVWADANWEYFFKTIYNICLYFGGSKSFGSQKNYSFETHKSSRDEPLPSNDGGGWGVSPFQHGLDLGPLSVAGKKVKAHGDLGAAVVAATHLGREDIWGFWKLFILKLWSHTQTGPLADLFGPWFRSQEWNGVASLPLKYHLEHSFKERPRGSPHGERVVRQGVAHLAEAAPLQVHGLNVLFVAGGAVAGDHRDGGEDLFQREEDVRKLLGFLEAKCLRFHFFLL